MRLRAAGGAFPLGAVLLGCGVTAGSVVGLLHLDHLPVALCLFKAVTGLPCLTCGTTRALGRLFALDLPGAVSVNPLAAVAALAIAAWGIADLALLRRSRALRLEVDPRLGRPLRLLAVAVAALNWVYLVAAGV